MELLRNFEVIGSNASRKDAAVDGHFIRRPQNVLVIKRLDSNSVTIIAKRIARILTQRFALNVFLEASALQEMCDNDPIPYKRWTCATEIDFIVAIGGDGTLLWVSQLFPQYIPPVLGISMGNLGYLNQFEVDEVEAALERVMESHFPISFRQRLQVQIFNEQNGLMESLGAFNECVIDRGRSSFLTILKVYYNDSYFTDVSADGLILATPSGSTAYSMSAGGPVVHPKVPCLLFTPICPHSLSFRPLIIPDSAVLRIEVSPGSHSSAWVAVDGRLQTEIVTGMYVKVNASSHPFPIVTKYAEHQLDSWLNSLNRSLYWNQRFLSSSSLQTERWLSPHAHKNATSNATMLNCTQVDDATHNSSGKEFLFKDNLAVANESKSLLIDEPTIIHQAVTNNSNTRIENNELAENNEIVENGNYGPTR